MNKVLNSKPKDNDKFINKDLSKSIINKHPGGRPKLKKYSPEEKLIIQKEVVQLIRNHQNLTTAAAKVGINDSTLSAWAIKNPAFDAEIKKARAEANAELIQELRDNKENRNYKSIHTFFILQNNSPEQYGDKRRIEHTGKDGQPILVKIIRYGDNKSKP